MVPVLFTALIATITVSLVSYWLASLNADAEDRQRFDAVGRMIESANFQFNQNVLDMLADVTSANWLAVDPQGRVVAQSLDRNTTSPWPTSSDSPLIAALPEYHTTHGLASVEFGGGWYRGARFPLRFPRGASDGRATSQVVVLYNDASRRADVWRAVSAPLLVGLSTIIVMFTSTLLSTRRLVKRVRSLQRQVNLIAKGEFTTPIETTGEDELGVLARDVASMALQLEQLWLRFRTWHNEQLLHQISGGLAHNLRNTLTGARMAVELAENVTTNGGVLPSSFERGTMPSREGVPAHDCNPSSQHPLKVAIGQLEQAEQYLSRILLAARGPSQTTRPMSMVDCFETLKTTLNPTAVHRGCRTTWNVTAVENQMVDDGPALIAAVSNLVWNAMEAGNEISITMETGSDHQTGVVTVTDNGPGPSSDIRDSLFEPFTTTKPDGLGLGLALVQRTAVRLGGEIFWHHTNEVTQFRLTFQTSQRVSTP